MEYSLCMHETCCSRFTWVIDGLQNRKHSWLEGEQIFLTVRALCMLASTPKREMGTTSTWTILPNIKSEVQTISSDKCLLSGIWSPQSYEYSLSSSF